MNGPPMSARVPADVLKVCRKLRSAGHEAHLVGGGVRDMLLGRAPADFDVATDAVPEAVLELFGKAFAVPTGLKHGTVTVLTETSPPRHVEVTTFRGEGAYLDGRRPSSVTYVKSLAEDLGILEANEKVAYRVTYIVDPQGIVRWVSVNDLSVGRNVNEVLRVLDALQTDELCPCNWTKGEATLTA